MTKQVDIAHGALRINETELAILRLVDGRGGRVGRAVSLPLSDVRQATCVSDVSARRAVRSLERGGLLEVQRRFADDGGQMANSYELTTMGALAVAAAGPVE